MEDDIYDYWNHRDNPLNTQLREKKIKLHAKKSAYCPFCTERFEREAKKEGSFLKKTKTIIFSRFEMMRIPRF